MGVEFALRLVLLLGTAQTDATWIDDPSAVPIVKAESYHKGERYRIRCDFNDDRVEDLALSHDISMFGRAGGWFVMYLGNDAGKFRNIGQFVADPGALALETNLDAIRLWTYMTGGGWVGEIGYYEIGEDGLSEFRSIRVYPRDGERCMSNAICQAVFENTDKPIYVECSTTVEGDVTWGEYKTILPPKMGTKADSGISAEESPDK